MNIQFQFDVNKAVQVMAYLVDQIGTMDKIKLIKLLYITDRKHFLVNGFPLTGDSQYAMPYGPVPSECLNELNGMRGRSRHSVYEYLHVENNEVSLTRSPQPCNLSDSEKATLLSVINAHGSKPTWQLVRETHAFPEYIEVNQKNTATPITYELILKHHGDETQFRHNRPVISPEMAAHAISPYPSSDADL